MNENHDDKGRFASAQSKSAYARRASATANASNNPSHHEKAAAIHLQAMNMNTGIGNAKVAAYHRGRMEAHQAAAKSANPGALRMPGTEHAMAVKRGNESATAGGLGRREDVTSKQASDNAAYQAREGRGKDEPHRSQPMKMNSTAMKARNEMDAGNASTYAKRTSAAASSKEGHLKAAEAHQTAAEAWRGTDAGTQEFHLHRASAHRDAASRAPSAASGPRLGGSMRRKDSSYVSKSESSYRPR